MALTAVVGVPVMVRMPLVSSCRWQEGEMAQVAPLSNPVLESQVLVPEPDWAWFGPNWNALPNCP